MSWGYEYREYVPVGTKIANGRKYAARVAERKKRDVQPVSIQGNKIAKTFWGKGWCDHLESFSDYANRLPRGRTYVRNGSVVDLQITTGKLEAIVAGSDPYTVTIKIERLKAAAWKKIRNDCSASIDSLLDLLGGKFSDGVMQRLTEKKGGLFPTPKEIKMSCSCPDGARMCKHVAAVLYGVGTLVDQQPELLFVLRGVDHHELVGEAVSADNLAAAFGEPGTELAGEDLGAMFGIELDTATSDKKPTKKSKAAKKKTPRKRATKPKKAVKAQSMKKRAGAKQAKNAVKKSSTKMAATSKKATTKKKGANKKSTRKKTGATNSVVETPTGGHKVVRKSDLKKQATTKKKKKKKKTARKRKNSVS